MADGAASAARPPIGINDIMMVLSDPTVVPSLEAERASLAGRIEQIDTMLAILKGQRAQTPQQPQTSVYPTLPAGLARVTDDEIRIVKRTMRPGYEYQFKDIQRAARLDKAVVRAALVQLRLANEARHNGRRGNAGRWSLVG